MAQINLRNRGLTLIELILYMSIFCFIFLVMMSSVFYLQKIIETNNQNYYAKSQIYRHLNLLQGYLYKSHITVENNNLNFFDANNNLILTQKLEQQTIKNIYKDKTFNAIDYVNVQSYTFELVDSNRVLKIEFSWLDNRGRVQNLTEYLIVVNQDS